MAAKECNHFLFIVYLFPGQELRFNFQLIFLFLFYDIHTFYAKIENSIDKLKSKQHLISQELVCSCFAIKKKTKKYSSQEVCMGPLTKYTCIMQS